MTVNSIDVNSTLPLVTIMIPVYNRDKYIGSCIESALTQSFNLFEIVVVDNCSTDSTWEICKEYATKDNRIRVFRNEENIGPVRNWLRCIQESKGIYGKILFSDDLIDPLFLEMAVPYMEDQDVAFVFSTCEIGEEPDDCVLAFKWSEGDCKLPSSKFIEDALFGGDLPLSPAAAMFRTADLKKNLMLDIPSKNISDFSRYGAGPDSLLYLLTANQYSSVAYLTRPLVFFRAHEESITIRKGQEYILDCYRQARIWFAENSLEEKVLVRLLVRTWLADMFKVRNWISFRSHAMRYTSHIPRQNIFKLMCISSREILGRLRKVVFK